MNKKLTNIFVIIACVSVITLTVVLKITRKEETQANKTEQTTQTINQEETQETIQNQEETQETIQNQEETQETIQNQELESEAPFPDIETVTPEGEVDNNDELNGYIPYIEIIDDGNVFANLPRWVNVTIPKEIEAYLKENDIKAKTIKVIAKTFSYNEKEENVKFICEMDSGDKIQITVGFLVQVILVEDYKEDI